MPACDYGLVELNAFLGDCPEFQIVVGAKEIRDEPLLLGKWYNFDHIFIQIGKKKYNPRYSMVMQSFRQ